MKTNAKQEFLTLLVPGIDVKCAKIVLDREDSWLDDEVDYERHHIALLPLDYTEEEYQQFLSDLDFNYDSGYGCQEVFGTIWCNNNTWFSRAEYDGSEWWRLNAYPEIPDYLKTKKD